MDRRGRGQERESESRVKKKQRPGRIRESQTDMVTLPDRAESEGGETATLALSVERDIDQEEDATKRMLETRARTRPVRVTMVYGRVKSQERRERGQRTRPYSSVLIFCMGVGSWELRAES